MNTEAAKTPEPNPGGGLLVIGHRGASAYTPENTHIAFAVAFCDNADGVEFDVRLARDGVPYVFHDATLDRTVGVHGEADSYTSWELMEMGAGRWFNLLYPERAQEDFEEERIPMFEEVLRRYSRHRLYAEMKCEDAARRPALARAVVDLIRAYQLTDRVVVKSFALDSLREVKRLAPEVRTAALFGRSWPRPFVPAARILAEAADCGADEISLHRSLLRAATVEEAQRRGFDVLVWTVNSRFALRRVLSLNLRAVFTDHPRRTRDWLAKLRAEGAARG